ncbi:hypothetical protein HYH03_011672 [Edaphochlamys debaryana]|uniref:Uncharacterized protein n=1 Tax=Edaphochlamys debaryana TaxID=47281 RepID=A0A835XUB3_9CHLO|nr:hypothetical protein HYH03_011672 [Edaphochlamys debaryana]|eukprot:KAG2489870.1 hypothetical protein HYH03_011672 [Edaphochlamys debaryana]
MLLPGLLLLAAGAAAMRGSRSLRGDARLLLHDDEYSPPPLWFSGDSGDYAPPPRDLAPPPEDLAPPPLDFASPPLDFNPPPVDFAPPPLDLSPPPLDLAPPPYDQDGGTTGLDSFPPPMDQPPPEDFAPPPLDLSPPPLDLAPPPYDQDGGTTGLDSFPPPVDQPPPEDFAPPPMNFFPPPMDFAPPPMDLSPPLVDFPPTPMDLSPFPVDFTSYPTDLSPYPVDFAPPPMDLFPPPVDFYPPPVDLYPPPMDLAPPPWDLNGGGSSSFDDDAPPPMTVPFPTDDNYTANSDFQWPPPMEEQAVPVYPPTYGSPSPTGDVDPLLLPSAFPVPECEAQPACADLPIRAQASDINATHLCFSITGQSAAAAPNQCAAFSAGRIRELRVDFGRDLLAQGNDPYFVKEVLSQLRAEVNGRPVPLSSVYGDFARGVRVRTAFASVDLTGMLSAEDLQGEGATVCVAKSKSWRILGDELMQLDAHRLYSKSDKMTSFRVTKDTPPKSMACTTTSYRSSETISIRFALVSEPADDGSGCCSSRCTDMVVRSFTVTEESCPDGQYSSDHGAAFRPCWPRVVAASCADAAAMCGFASLEVFAEANPTCYGKDPALGSPTVFCCAA